MDDIDHYVKLLSGQRGGEFPVFRGARYVQYGNGFGDVLRGIWRTVFPVIARGAATFMQNLASNKEEGKDWSKAAKEAAIPALTETGDLVAFEPGSTTVCKLHFRRRRGQW